MAKKSLSFIDPTVQTDTTKHIAQLMQTAFKSKKDQTNAIHDLLHRLDIHHTTDSKGSYTFGRAPKQNTNVGNLYYLKQNSQ